ncbi:MAG: aspartate aminotransferase family protein [Rhodospirillaceae bacterium]|nr:aspartate aminotransferase family protein [Rhodospirillaceae bacterium]
MRNTTVRWQDLDLRHHLHPFTHHLGLAKERPRIIVRADGVWLWDSDGNRILDGMAGLWCVNVGYGRTALAEAAYRQMLELPYYNTFFKTATPPAIELAEVLVELTPPGLNRVFYGSTGSDANDTIVRLVRHYWALEGRPQRQIIIGRENGYHGSTMVGASLGGMKYMHAQGGLPLPGFSHIMQPYWYGLGGDMTPEAFGLKAAQALEERILELGPDTVAAFIGEPIQGAGGVIIPPATYWPEIQRICRKYDILLIADEVICGFGRTGAWFGCDTFGIQPDLMTMAKGITSGYVPLSAVMVGDRVADVLVGKGGEFAHGYTYCGHPVACAVALANIAILKEERLIERVRDETGPYLAERLATLADHPLVGEVRSCGLIAAVELVEDKAARRPFDPALEVGVRARDACFRHGLVMRATRDTMLLSPPLIWEKAHIDECVARARAALDEVAAGLGR